MSEHKRMPKGEEFDEPEPSIRSYRPPKLRRRLHQQAVAWIPTRWLISLFFTAAFCLKCSDDVQVEVSTIRWTCRQRPASPLRA